MTVEVGDAEIGVALGLRQDTGRHPVAVGPIAGARGPRFGKGGEQLPCALANAPLLRGDEPHEPHRLLADLLLARRA